MLITAAEYKDFVLLFPVYLLSFIRNRGTIEDLEFTLEEEAIEEPKDHEQQLVRFWHNRYKDSDLYDCDCSRCRIPLEVEKRRYRKKKRKEMV